MILKLRFDKQVSSFLGSLILLLMLSMLMLFLFGDPFGILAALGLQGGSGKTGAYVDCSLPSNRESPYCAGAKKPKRPWGDNQKGAAFSLHGKN